MWKMVITSKSIGKTIAMDDKEKPYTKQAVN